MILKVHYDVFDDEDDNAKIDKEISLKLDRPARKMPSLITSRGKKEENGKMSILTLALKTPRLIVVPAQFRTSVAKSVGSGLSYHLNQPFIPMLKHPLQTHNCSSINTNHKVKPRF